MPEEKVQEWSQKERALLEYHEQQRVDDTVAGWVVKSVTIERYNFVKEAFQQFVVQLWRSHRACHGHASEMREGGEGGREGGESKPAIKEARRESIFFVFFIMRGSSRRDVARVSVCTIV